MTAQKLQDDLVDVLEKDILKDLRTLSPGGEWVDGVHVFEQELPKLEDEDEDDPDKYFPYAIVKLAHGKTGGDVNQSEASDDDDWWHVQIDILFGAYEASQKCTGHRQVMEMIQKITDRFQARPLLNKMFRAEQKMEWDLQDESDGNTYPYFFGGLEMTFSVPKKGREDPYV